MNGPFFWGLLPITVVRGLGLILGEGAIVLNIGEIRRVSESDPNTSWRALALEVMTSSSARKRFSRPIALSHRLARPAQNAKHAGFRGGTVT